MAQQQQPERHDAGTKVTVACKLPAGLILRGFDERQEREAVLGGGVREFKVYRPMAGQAVKINGPAVPFGKSPECKIVCGFALTEGVSKDLWDSWYDANREQPYCKNGMVFAYESVDRVSARAREFQKLETGFEQIDPNNPGKKVRGITKADPKDK